MQLAALRSIDPYKSGRREVHDQRRKLLMGSRSIQLKWYSTRDTHTYTIHTRHRNVGVNNNNQEPGTGTHTHNPTEKEMGKTSKTKHKRNKRKINGKIQRNGFFSIVEAPGQRTKKLLDRTNSIANNTENRRKNIHQTRNTHAQGITKLPWIAPRIVLKRKMTFGYGTVRCAERLRTHRRTHVFTYFGTFISIKMAFHVADEGTRTNQTQRAHWLQANYTTHTHQNSIGQFISTHSAIHMHTAFDCSVYIVMFENCLVRSNGWKNARQSHEERRIHRHLFGCLQINFGFSWRFVLYQ